MLRISFSLVIVLLLTGAAARSQLITISGKDLRLEQVFSEIIRQANIEFFYQSDLLRNARPVTLHVQQLPVVEVLKQCLAGQGLGFDVRGRTIVIFRDINASQELHPVNKMPADTALVIRGQVVDRRGEPVPMASVVLPRTQSGTLTDPSGSFSLRIKELQASDVVTVSFVGFQDQQIRLHGKTSLGRIVLQVAEKVLDEMIVTAYGTTTERFRTGDLSTIRAAEIEKTPAFNVIEALSGRVPGLYIRQDGSNPGSAYKINLRGVNLIATSSALLGHGMDVVHALSKPLIVVDGLTMAPDLIPDRDNNFLVNPVEGFTGASGSFDQLYWLNPLDVESITVLKDAEATALYGSRASNGVIIINTRKGKAGKLSIDITFNTGLHAQARRLKLLDTQQYLAMRREAWESSYQAGLLKRGIDTPDAYNAVDLLVWDKDRYTDWQKVLWGSAPVYNAGLSLSGGQGKTVYRLASGYNHFTSSYPSARGIPVFRETRGSLSLSLTTRSSNNRLKAVTSAVASAISSYQPTYNPDNYIFLAPNAPDVFDKDGHLNYPEWRVKYPGGMMSPGNPLTTLAKPLHTTRATVFAHASLSYELIPRLLLKLGGGFSAWKGKQVTTQTAVSFDPQFIPGRQAGFGDNGGTGFNIEPGATYEIRHGQHHVDVMAGGSFQSDIRKGHVADANGFTADELMNNPDSAANVSHTNETIQRKSLSFLGRISYRYRDEWLIDLSACRDGSSSFGADRRFGNFGAVGLGWIFTKARFLKKMPFLSFGKIRGSYGVTGSQSASPYAYLSTFRPAITYNWGTLPSLQGTYYNFYGSYQGINAFTVTRVANPTLGWAQSNSFDLGIDLYFLKDQRLKFTVQWYQKKTGNQLANQSVSAVTGTDSYLLNAPLQVQNRGVEAVAGYTSPLLRSGISWHVQVNWATNSNKLLSDGNSAVYPINNFYETGKPIVYQALYPAFLRKETGVYNNVDPYARGAAPVPYKVSNYPDFTGGLQAGISYQGLSLSLSWVFAKQQGYTDVRGAGYPGLLDAPAVSNQPAYLLQEKRWQGPADSTIGGAFHAARVYSYPGMDLYWGDASYIALKNATLHYSLPKNWLRKAGINGLTVYARAENLLLLSLAGYKGTNPEQPGLEMQVPLRMTLVSGFAITL